MSEIMKPPGENPTADEAMAFQRMWYAIFDKMDEYFEVAQSAQSMWDFTHDLVTRPGMLLFKDLLAAYGVEPTDIPADMREPVLRACVNALVTVVLFRQKHDDEQYWALVENDKTMSEPWSTESPSAAVH